MLSFWLYHFVYGSVLSVHKCSPTRRAPDGWDSPRFLAGFWLEAGSGKAALPPPAHPRVTHPVGRVDPEETGTERLEDYCSGSTA